MKFWKIISQPYIGFLILLILPFSVFYINQFLLENELAKSNFEFYLKLLSGTAVLFGVPVALYNLNLSIERRTDEIVKRDEERSFRQKDLYKREYLGKIKVPKIIYENEHIYASQKKEINSLNFYTEIRGFWDLTFMHFFKSMNEIDKRIHSKVPVKIDELEKDEKLFIQISTEFYILIIAYLIPKIGAYIVKLFNLIEEIRKDRLLNSDDKKNLIRLILNDYLIDYLRVIYIEDNNLLYVNSTSVERYTISNSCKALPSYHVYKKVIKGYEDVEQNVLLMNDIEISRRYLGMRQMV